MKGNDKVIALLNDVLTLELTAVNQYWVHARMCENWGYMRLWEKLRAESLGEMKHADKLVERILFLDGVPNLQRLGKINIGETVPEQLSSDLRVEHESIETLNKAVDTCRSVDDNGSRMLFEELLADSEEHADWIEAQLDLIKQVGQENYLAQQING